MTDYREYRYRSADDRLDLYARIYESACPPAAPPLLLMHGLTRNSSDFEGLAAHLAQQYRLIVPDQRGRGNSQYDDDPSNYAPQVYANDMFALLASLDITKTALIGTSMGGLMAMLMAAVSPGMFRGIVLNDVGTVLDTAGLERIRGYVGKAAPPRNWSEATAYAKGIVGDAFPNVTDDSFWETFARNNFEEKNGRLIARYDPAIAEGISGEDATAVPPDLWPLWDGLGDVPVLVVRGALSDLLSAETVAEMGRRHPDNFAAVEIPHRGHAPMLDEDEAVAAIRSFLQGLH